MDRCANATYSYSIIYIYIYIHTYILSCSLSHIYFSHGSRQGRAAHTQCIDTTRNFKIVLIICVPLLAQFCSLDTFWIHFGCNLGCMWLPFGFAGPRKVHQKHQQFNAEGPFGMHLTSVGFLLASFWLTLCSIWLLFCSFGIF